jgi:hypothetical protein
VKTAAGVAVVLLARGFGVVEHPGPTIRIWEIAR